VTEAEALVLILSAPLAIPAMVFLCACVEFADELSRGQIHKYVYCISYDYTATDQRY
jgi:hypothetical protein